MLGSAGGGGGGAAARAGGGGGDAEIAGRADDAADSDLPSEPDRGDIAGAGEGVAQRQLAAIVAARVARRPSADRDRPVGNRRIGGEAGTQGGEIDEQFEGRAGLAAAHGRAIERAAAVIAAAEH